MGLTPTGCVDTCRYQFYEATAKFIADAEIYGYAWQAEQIINNAIECCQTSTAHTTTTYTQEYTKPTGCYLINRVTFDGVKLKRIDVTDQDQMDGAGYGSSLSVGNPHSYYEYGEKVGLYPVPDSSATLKYWFVAEPASLTTASTQFTVPAFARLPIPDYCLFRMFAKDQDDGRAQFHANLWANGLNRVQSEWARLNRRDGHYVVRNEDNYPATELGLI